MVSGMVAVGCPAFAADYSHKVTVTGVQQGAWNVRVEIDPASGYNSQPTALKDVSLPNTANNRKPAAPNQPMTPTTKTAKPKTKNTTPTAMVPKTKSPPTNGTNANPTNAQLLQSMQKMEKNYAAQLQKSTNQSINQALQKMQANQPKQQAHQPMKPGNQPTQIPPNQLSALRNSIMKSVRARNRRMTQQLAQMLQNNNTPPDATQNVTDAMNQFLDALGQMQAQQAYNQALQQQQQQPPPDDSTPPDDGSDAEQQAMQNLGQTMQNQLSDQAQQEVGTDMADQMQQAGQDPLPVEVGTNPSITDTTSSSALKPSDYARIADEAPHLAQGDLSKEKHYLEVALRCVQDVAADPNTPQSSVQQAKQYAGTTLVDKFTNLQQRINNGSSDSQALKDAIDQDIRTCVRLNSG